MTVINTAAILALADETLRLDTERFGTVIVGADDAFSTALQTVVAKRKAEAEEKAAEQIVNVVEIKNALVIANAQRVAALKQEIANIEAASADLSLAQNYGFVTRNFLPLALLTGSNVPVGAKKELLSVPKGWVPPTATAAAATA